MMMANMGQGAVLVSILSRIVIIGSICRRQGRRGCCVEKVHLLVTVGADISVDDGVDIGVGIGIGIGVDVDVGIGVGVDIGIQ